MIGGTSQCQFCLNRFKNIKGTSCEAFPEGISDDVFMNFMLHNKNIPGDNGKIFELHFDAGDSKEVKKAVLAEYKEIGLI